MEEGKVGPVGCPGSRETRVNFSECRIPDSLTMIGVVKVKGFTLFNQGLPEVDGKELQFSFGTVRILFPFLNQVIFLNCLRNQTRYCLRRLKKVSSSAAPRSSA